MNYGLCSCGCGEKIEEKKWHKYRSAMYISGHNIRVINPLSILDKNKDKRKGQTGYLAPKIIANIRHDAIKAGYVWLLSDIFVYKLITGDCVYCGSESKWPNARNGIDRVNSSIDYVPDNCVSCCKFCNRAKSNRSMEEFLNWAIKLSSNIKKNEGNNV